MINLLQIASMRETLVSLSNPYLLIQSHGKRFLSALSVFPGGILSNGRLPAGTRIYSDYHVWKTDSKGVGNKAMKAITLNDNLIYIILP
jgi:hypothetical protein